MGELTWAAGELTELRRGLEQESRQREKLWFAGLFSGAGLLLILLFSLKLGWFPSGGNTLPFSMVLPALTAGTHMAATVTRMTRSSMLEVIRQDYICTARAKGLSEKVVILKHAFRNALIPIVTTTGITFGTAIGGALAAARGAAVLCYVPPAEHLRLPDVNDVKEGIVAARIAAHAADIAKGVPGAREWDDRMSFARKKLDWEKMFELAIDPEKARRYRAESKPEKEDTCSMCGNFCAVRNMNRILDGEIVSIFDE